jgi:hypothetical protein
VILLQEKRLFGEGSPENVIDVIRCAVVLHGVEIASPGYDPTLLRMAEVVIQFAPEVSLVIGVEVDDVFPINERVGVRDHDMITEHKSTRAHRFPETKVALPVGGVHRDNNARSCHEIEIFLTHRLA